MGAVHARLRRGYAGIKYQIFVGAGFVTDFDVSNDFGVVWRIFATRPKP